MRLLAETIIATGCPDTHKYPAGVPAGMIDAARELSELADEGNAELVRRLVPTRLPVTGARIPRIRALAKRIAKDDWRGYIAGWSCGCLEDALLRAAVIGYIDVGIGERLRQYDAFMPYIDNWSVCDTACATFRFPPEDAPAAWEYARKCLRSGREFEMRFGAVTMAGRFVDREHVAGVLSELGCDRGGGLYYKMGAAWALSVCYVGFPAETAAELERGRLDDFTHSKTVQKICESLRVGPEAKAAVRLLRRPRRAPRPRRRWRPRWPRRPSALSSRRTTIRASCTRP